MLTALLIVFGLVAIFGGRYYNNFARGNNKINSAERSDRLYIPELPLAPLVGIIMLVLAMLADTVVQINAGSVGIHTRFGATTGAVYEQGLHFKAPFIEDITVLNVQVQKEPADAAAASKDLQEVSAKLALNYHLDASKASVVFTQIGVFYKDRIIDPTMQEAFKATTAQFTAQELITQREEVKKKAFEFLRERLARSNIIVDDLNVTNFDFSKEFNSAVERANVANREIETSRQNLEQTKVKTQTQVVEADAYATATVTKATADGKAKVIAAEAEATANKVIAESLTPAFLTFQAQRTWNGQLPQVMTSGSSVPFINVPTR